SLGRRHRRPARSYFTARGSLLMAYFPEHMPLPLPDRITEPFWEGCKRHQLLIQRCSRCGTYRYGPQPVCYACQCFEWDWIASEGRGEVYSFTIARHSVHPATAESIPYNIAVVALRDCGGVWLTSNITDCDPDDIEIGMPVRVTWEDVGEG